MIPNILVTGAFGQIGIELVPQLQKKYGFNNVFALAHKNVPKQFKGQLIKGDVTDKQQLKKYIQEYKITQIYHLAAVLSVVGELNPKLVWDVNLQSLRMILDLAVELKLQKIFWPSSIAIFGPTTPSINTPQHTIIQPTTMYGITKRAGQMLCQYYHKKYNVDVRSLRYPGIISWKQMPGGGVTDYAVGIFYGALSSICSYTCYLQQNTCLPMMYIDDAITATITLMQAPSSSIKIRSSYNLSAFSFNPKQLAQLIRQHIAQFKIIYQPDHRLMIASSWPDSIDDSDARHDWKWKPNFQIKLMIKIMLIELKKKIDQQEKIKVISK